MYSFLLPDFTFPMLMHCACKTNFVAEKVVPYMEIRVSAFLFKLEVEKWKMLFITKYSWRKHVPQSIVRQIHCSMIPRFSNLKALNRKETKILNINLVGNALQNFRKVKRNAWKYAETTFVLQNRFTLSWAKTLRQKNRN